MSDFSIVIVSFNSAGVLERCLRACARTGAAEIVVVDNASTDDTLFETRASSASGLRVIANPTNRGFAAAVNQGVKAASSPFVLVINPDVEPPENTRDLIDEFVAPSIAAAAGMLVDQNGRPQAGFTLRRLPTAAALSFETLGINRLWPANPVNRRYRCADVPLEAPAVVEQPAGAFLMLRRSAWAAIGGLDESFYPIWFEDVDFCARLIGAGYQTRWRPGVRARHVGGHSAGRLPWASRQQHWYASLLRYASKHFSRAGCAAVCASVIVSCVPRGLTGIVLERRPAVTFVRIMRLALRHLAETLGGSSARSGSWKGNARAAAG